MTLICPTRRSPAQVLPTPASVGGALRAQVTLASLTTIAAFAATVSTSTTAEAKPPARVSATYSVNFAGVRVGRFNFTTEFRGQRYTTRANAKVKLLLGALTWDGNVTGTGTVRKGEPAPSRFSQRFDSERNFVFRRKKKTKTADLRFRGNRVVATDLTPPRKTADRAPLKPNHMVDVLDPAAAVLALTRDSGDGRPCDRRLKIFDGRMRFDLRLSYLRTERIAGVRGADGRGIVCSVTYRPIGGHKLKDEDNRKMMRSGAVELVLRPVAGVDVYIPQRVRVKTSRGTAELVAQKVDILTAERRRIALVN